MKRLVLVALLCGVGLLVPTVASAAVKQVLANSSSSAYCIAVDNGPTAATFTVRAPGGGVLATQRVATATPGVNCDGASTPGAEAFTATIENFQGASITADAGGGLVTTFPVPFAAYDGTGGSGVVKVGNLPSASGTLTIGLGAPIAYTGPGYSTPSAVPVGSTTIDATSTVGAIPYHARFEARQFSIDTSYYGSISISGTNPLGSTVAASVSVGGAVQQSTSMTPAVDSGQYEQGDMALRIPPGAVVTVTQPGWFSHSVTLPSITARANGVDVSIPAVAGETATASFGLAFQATSGLPSSDPLSCLSFGNASYMLSQCGSVGARFTATFPLFFGATDNAYVTLIEPDGDHGSSRVSGSGLVAYLDDGSIGLSGFAPYAALTVSAATPAVASASVSGSTWNDGSVYFGGEGSIGSIPAKLVSGTTVTATGPATGGVARSFLLNLELQASGTIVSGTTYPGGHVAVTTGRPTGSSPTVYATADGAGAFALDVGPMLPRDSVRVVAADPSGTMSSVRTLYPGSPQPQIQGLADQQLVRGTIVPTALGGGPAGILWGGDGPGGLVAAAPFSYVLDTTLLKDGPHLVDAFASGLYNGLEDYLWVRVDNTPPVVSAGADQYVGVGYSAVLVTNAHDASGLGSVVATFGDGASLTQPAAELGQAIRHVYAKAGTYTATVTATDAAGNSTTDSAVIHAVGTLSEQVSGRFPTTFKQAKKLKKRKNLAVKFTSHMAGTLRLRVLDTRSKVRASGTLTFSGAGKKATFTVKSKKWAKGRYTVVLQFTDATGMPGPVVVQPLRIT